PASQGAIGNDPNAEFGAGRKIFDFGDTRHGVVERLRRDRPRYAERIADMDHLDDPPGAVVAESPVTDIPLSDQLAHRADGLFQRHALIVRMQIVKIDPVGSQPLEAAFSGMDHPPAAEPIAIGNIGIAGTADLGRQYPVAAISGNGLPDDFLGATVRI